MKLSGQTGGSEKDHVQGGRMRGVLVAGVGIAIWLGAFVLLWRGAVWVGQTWPMAFDHQARLYFAVIVTVGVMAFTLGRSAYRRQWPVWMTVKGRGLGQFGLGAAGYGALALLTIGGAVLLGQAQVEADVTPEAITTLAFLVLLVFLSEAFPEEILFRGWLMHDLARWTSPWGCVIIQALVFTGFAAAIGSFTSVQDVSFIACFGLVLGMVRVAAGTIWAPMGLHLVFITAQQSAQPQWQLWAGNPHSVLQIFCLTIIPFSLIAMALFDRVSRASRSTGQQSKA